MPAASNLLAFLCLPEIVQGAAKGQWRDHRPMSHANPTSPATSAASSIADLYTLILADGLPVQTQGASGRQELRYKVVRLRETTLADVRYATRAAERVAMHEGAPRLLVSDSDYDLAMTMRHCERFEADGLSLDQSVLDLDLFAKLSHHDLGLLQARVALIALAAQVRYGLLTQAQLDGIINSQSAAGAAAPQPLGQAQTVGELAADPESGPALLTDFGAHAPV